MNRDDLIDLERMYARIMRREASRRSNRYPAAAEQLRRWAAAADARVEAIRCGPLFDLEKAQP